MAASVFQGVGKYRQGLERKGATLERLRFHGANHAGYRAIIPAQPCRVNCHGVKRIADDFTQQPALLDSLGGVLRGRFGWSLGLSNEARNVARGNYSVRGVWPGSDQSRRDGQLHW